MGYIIYLSKATTINTHTHTYALAYMHTHTRIHTHTRSCVHTHTRIHAHTRALIQSIYVWRQFNLRARGKDCFVDKFAYRELAIRLISWSTSFLDLIDELANRTELISLLRSIR